MTVGQVAFKVLPLLLIFYSNYPPITCQNCGLPRTIRVSDRINETWNTGQQITPPILACNVVSINVSENPGNFSNITFVREEGSSCGQLSVNVGKPLWKPPEPSFIDESKLKEITVSLEVECGDGEFKTTDIIIPIEDINTATPRFNKESYSFITEPCVFEWCTLFFDTDVFVIDEDVDEENAKVILWTSEPRIKILHNFSVLEPWYDDNNKREQLKQKGFRTRVKLEYMPSEFQHDTITFPLFANNTAKPADQTLVYIATTNVSIKFVETAHRRLPPIFNHSLYYAYVKYDGEPIELRPKSIFARVHGDMRKNIEYQIVGDPELMSIDGDGNVTFIKDLPKVAKVTIKEYRIIARRTHGCAADKCPEASVPLIVFLTPTCECDSGITPWPLPGLCPVPGCPDPDPCPGTTTLAPTEPPETTTELPEESSTAPYPTTTTEDPSVTEEDQSETPNPTTTPTTTTTTSPTTTSTSPVTTTPTSTTTSPYPTTTEELTEPTETPDPTSTPSPPTPPPGECQCNCKEFSCSEPQKIDPSLNSTEYSIYPDPYNCTKYHRCPNSFEGPINEDDTLTFECPPDTIFCPKMTACTTVDMCIERSYQNRSTAIKGGYGDYGGWNGSSEDDSGEEDCPECQCRIGLSPEHPDNVCTRFNHNENIPDPLYCDVFHKCQLVEVGNHRYIDYPMRCQPGLIFCPGRDACVRPGEHDACADACTTKMMFQQCDVCIMGQWKDFDIFKQKYV